MSLDRISIEVTNRCAKSCWFCYNHSLPEGDTHWTANELVSFVRDCADHGVKAVSFGGSRQRRSHHRRLGLGRMTIQIGVMRPIT